MELAQELCLQIRGVDDLVAALDALLLLLDFTQAEHMQDDEDDDPGSDCAMRLYSQTCP